MIKIFTFDDQGLVINTPEVLLITEFKDLYDVKRNKTKEDKTGKLRTRAFKEFAYLYLNVDWQSPYADLSVSDRKLYSLQDSGLTIKDIDDKVQAAEEKYRDLQQTRSLRLLNAAYKAMDNIRDYFEKIDFEIIDEETGKPMYSAKDVIANIKNLSGVLDGLDALELRVKKELEIKSDLRGDAEAGLLD